MPALRAYRSKEGHYVLAGIKGKIVTYRLSPEGAKRLHDNGIPDDGKFPWSLLLELIRQGEAFTGSGGADIDLSGWTQTELPLFASQHEPAPTDPVPCCSCGKLEELHIVGLTSKKSAQILCEACQALHRNDTCVSVPLYLITTPAALERLLERSGLSGDDTVSSYRDLLSLNLEARYLARGRLKNRTIQTGLFHDPEEPQGSFL